MSAGKQIVMRPPLSRAALESMGMRFLVEAKADLQPMLIMPPTSERVLIPMRYFPNGVDPKAYTATVTGNCLEPKAYDGDMVIISPALPLRPGGYVAIFPKHGGAYVKRLVSARRETGPRAIVVEMLNPATRFELRWADLHAVHAVVDFVRPTEFEKWPKYADHVRSQRDPRAIP